MYYFPYKTDSEMMYSSVVEKCETGAATPIVAAPNSTSVFSPLDLRGGHVGSTVVDDDEVDSDCSADINVESDDDIHLHVSPTRQSPTGTFKLTQIHS